jgi:hypothetical protein
MIFKEDLVCDCKFADDIKISVVNSEEIIFLENPFQNKGGKGDKISDNR